jgi:hypothetical protein
MRTIGNLCYLFGVAFLIAAMAVNAIPPRAALAAPASIWTTGTTCIDPDPQDDNHYAVGESVYVRGSNFDPSVTVFGTVSGQPGGSSCDPGQVVANFSASTDGDGYFCVLGYTVQPGDCGEYTVDVSVGGNKKNDNFRVDETATPTPTNTPTNTGTSTPTDTPTNTPTNTPTDTPTNTPTETPTNTPTNTGTNTPTNTPTDTPTDTPTNTPTDTPTDTPTSTPTDTPTNTNTPTVTNTVGPNTPTITPTNTPTNTNTPTVTPTNTPSNTPTNTPSNTPTDPPTNTPTNTQPSPPTNTPTETSGPQPPPTSTPSPQPQPPTASATPTTAPLIPVTGVKLGGSWHTSTILFQLGIGFVGLGLVLNGLARERKEFDV